MTILVDQAIRELADSYDFQYSYGSEPIAEETEVETWEDVCEYRQLLNMTDYMDWELLNNQNNEQRRASH